MKYDGQYGGFPPHVKQSDTSKEAALSVVDTAMSVRHQVLRLIAKCGTRGLTTDEIERILARSHQTVSARVKELRNDGLVVDSGSRRRTRFGRRAAVWVTRENAPPDLVDREAGRRSRPRVKKPSVVDIENTLSLMRLFVSGQCEENERLSTSLSRVMRWLQSLCPECRTCQGTGEVEIGGEISDCLDCRDLP